MQSNQWLVGSRKASMELHTAQLAMHGIEIDNTDGSVQLQRPNTMPASTAELAFRSQQTQ